MNRRSFLLGLLSSTAAPTIAKAVPALIHKPSYARIRTGLPSATWRKLYEGMPWLNYNSLYNGIPIKEVAEFLKQENEVLKTIYGPFPNLTDDDNYLDDDDV